MSKWKRPRSKESRTKWDGTESITVNGVTFTFDYKTLTVTIRGYKHSLSNAQRDEVTAWAVKRYKVATAKPPEPLEIRDSLFSDCKPTII